MSGTAKRPTFRTESGGALYYGSTYLTHPSLYPQMDVKSTLVELVRTSVIAEEAAVRKVCDALLSAYTAGQFDCEADS